MSARSALALRALDATARLSRALRAGGGSMIGGRVALAIDPGLLETLRAGRTVALVSGTNGKTTTTRLLAEALREIGPVATSAAGANMPAGLATALAEAPAAPLAALEVDEGYLGRVAELLAPRVVVLLNLSRDQLDRVSEVRMVAARWRGALAGTDATVVANADDPLVVWAASAARSTRFVAVGGVWHEDAYHCPVCDQRIEFAGEAGWSCPCGFARPPLDARLDAEQLRLADGEVHRLELALPGRFNQANAALAALAARELGVELGAALRAIGRVDAVAGRFALAAHAGAAIRLLLAKNPAGWAELLELLHSGNAPVVVAINARDADGHDPSWLWDLPFERLAGRLVLASGERCLDLAVRLRHAGVAHVIEPDARAALARAGAAHVDFVGNYTAFQDLRARLGASSPGPARSGTDGAPAHAGTVVAEQVSEEAPAEAPRRGPRRTASSPSAVRVVVVFPDLLGTYGDAGNGRVLANRALWRGHRVELVLAPSDRPLPASGDLYCIGGGEDGPQVRAAEGLRSGALGAAVETGAVVLAVCAGYQVLGHRFPGADGTAQRGLGLLDVETVRGRGRRAVGEITVDPRAVPLGRLTGFENHAGWTALGPAAAPLGRVVHGTGNGFARSDGAVAGRVFGTYLHGPVLARNPELADHLLSLALGTPISGLDDAEEAALRAARLAAVPREIPVIGAALGRLHQVVFR